MKIGLVGYQGSGKSTLWEWLTGIAPDPSLGHTTQSAMVTIPDERIEPLCEIYHPKKITRASLELIDTPGLSRTHEGSAKRLGLIREAGCLVVVVAAFGGSDPAADLVSFEEDVLLADLEIVSGRVERLQASVKKPKPNRDQEIAELEALLPILETLEAGKPLREMELSEKQEKAVRAFQLITRKPRLVVVNTADDEENPQRFNELAGDAYQVVAMPVGLELELSRMDAKDRAEFEEEMELTKFDRDGFVRTLLDVSQQILFFTAGEKEVRTWLLRQGGTALEVADTIHSDLARGFIRAETMASEDLIRLGSEREIKAAGLMRQEPKDYIVKPADILNIRFNV